LEGNAVVLLAEFKKDGHPNWEAASQGTIIVRALYENRPEVVQSMLSPISRVMAWQFNGGFLTPWPPSFCLATTAPGQYWVFWAGTTSIRQTGNHIWGSVILPNIVGAFKLDRLGSAQTNWPWLTVMADQMELITELIDVVPPGSTWHFFGHSYGGAIAALAGEYIAAATDGHAQVMTIGCPRVWSKGHLLANPDVMYHLQSEKDLVTSSPAPGDPLGYVVAFGASYAGGALSSLIITDWSDHGTDVLLTADGTGVAGGDIPVPPPHWVTDTFLANHFTANYMGRIIKAWEVQGN
jgi:hypothetical protein